MRLSTAINLGRTLLKPKAFTIHDPKTESGCAQGMALAALGSRFYFYTELEDLYPWLLQDVTKPGCACPDPYTMREPRTARAHIQHLFDWHVMSIKDLSLDQLIAWVESGEPAETTPDLPLDIQLAECETEPVAVREEVYAYG